METSGKIFVVAVVLAVILAGIFVYLVTIDRKVKKLERQAKERPENL